MRPWKAPSSASIRATSASVQSAIWRKLPTPSPLSSTASLGPTPFSSCRLSAPVVDDAGAGFATGGGGTVGSAGIAAALGAFLAARSEEHTSELQSLMRISYAVFCLKKKTQIILNTQYTNRKSRQQSKSEPPITLVNQSISVTST